MANQRHLNIIFKLQAYSLHLNLLRKSEKCAHLHFHEKLSVKNLGYEHNNLIKFSGSHIYIGWVTWFVWVTEQI